MSVRRVRYPRKKKSTQRADQSPFLHHPSPHVLRLGMPPSKGCYCRGKFFSLSPFWEWRCSGVWGLDKGVRSCSTRRGRRGVGAAMVGYILLVGYIYRYIHTFNKNKEKGIQAWLIENLTYFILSLISERIAWQMPDGQDCGWREAIWRRDPEIGVWPKHLHYSSKSTHNWRLLRYV